MSEPPDLECRTCGQALFVYGYASWADIRDAYARFGLPWFVLPICRDCILDYVSEAIDRADYSAD